MTDTVTYAEIDDSTRPRRRPTATRRGKEAGFLLDSLATTGRTGCREPSARRTSRLTTVRSTSRAPVKLPSSRARGNPPGTNSAVNHKGRDRSPGDHASRESSLGARHECADAPATRRAVGIDHRAPCAAIRRNQPRAFADHLDFEADGHGIHSVFTASGEGSHVADYTFA
jgi:hypothetical protein